MLTSSCALLRPDRSYVITGGLGGFGLALAVWLSNRGARNLVLTSKRGMRNGGQRKVVQLLESRGVKVRPTPLTGRHIPLLSGLSALLARL
jgi:fatty acid synthase